jgi:hypothetical protein
MKCRSKSKWANISSQINSSNPYQLAYKGIDKGVDGWHSISWLPFLKALYIAYVSIHVCRRESEREKVRLITE